MCVIRHIQEKEEKVQLNVICAALGSHALWRSALTSLSLAQVSICESVILHGFFFKISKSFTESVVPIKSI